MMQTAINESAMPQGIAVENAVRTVKGAATGLAILQVWEESQPGNPIYMSEYYGLLSDALHDAAQVLERLII